LKPGQEDKSNATFLRYYHVFEESELKETCQQIGNVHVLDYYYDQGNWCVVLEKISTDNK